MLELICFLWHKLVCSWIISMYKCLNIFCENLQWNVGDGSHSSRLFWRWVIAFGLKKGSEISEIVAQTLKNVKVLRLNITDFAAHNFSLFFCVFCDLRGSVLCDSWFRCVCVYFCSSRKVSLVLFHPVLWLLSLLHKHGEDSTLICYFWLWFWTDTLKN